MHHPRLSTDSGKHPLKPYQAFHKYHLYRKCNTCTVIFRTPLMLVAWCAADALREQGVAHVVYYDAEKTSDLNILHVNHFSHAFFATLRSKSATVPEVSLLEETCNCKPSDHGIVPSPDHRK